jgi:hypothetical protein
LETGLFQGRGSAMKTIVFSLEELSAKVMPEGFMLKFT